MLEWLKSDETPEVEDEKTFRKRIRQDMIKKETCQTTTGICVFEHDDDNDLDEQEQKILDNLRTAHEDWMEKNPKQERTDRDRHGININKGIADPFNSVKVRVS